MGKVEFKGGEGKVIDDDVLYDLEEGLEFDFDFIDFIFVKFVVFVIF